MINNNLKSFCKYQANCVKLHNHKCIDIHVRSYTYITIDCVTKLIKVISF